MKIYETGPAPNPRRVRIFAAEKGITDIEYIQLDLKKGENLTPEHKARNPLTKVPVLELDDGTCISETIAICRYFEETVPEPSLMGETAIEKATIEMWQRWCDFYFMLPVGMCFQHSTGYFADRMTPVKEWGDESGKNAAKFMAFLNQHLESNDYIAGDKFTVADITAVCALDFARVVGLRPSEDQTHLLRWHKQVSARPSMSA
ncbi:glutathione S-transferase family protein [Spongorhabdus nitratireducens]